ncbi:Chemotaxis protein CheY [Thermoflexales bacterium]|nr:Chemotaxis protein CheY [Thermoflexales bacterium]
MASIRVLLADDNEFFLEAASQFLAQALLTVVGLAYTGREAVEQVNRLKPDLVLMDIAMPEMNGLEATRHIKAQPDPPRVIVLTLHDISAYAAEARAVGADNLVTKTAMGVELLPAINLLFATQEPDIA